LLDRLPLAIEMAAGRLSAMSLPDLTALLSERLDILRSTDRDVADRHRTLADLVAWSETLLDPEGRRLFTDLSVFAGPVVIDDIVGVLSVDRADRVTIVEGLTSLVDQSLVSADLTVRPARYRLLDTTRSHARRLRSGRGEREHAEWFVAVVDSADRDLRTVREPSGNERLAAALAELRAAHTWARNNDHDLACRLTCAMAHYGHSRLWGEPATWAAHLLDRLDSDHPLTAVVMATLAADAGVRADYDRATRLAGQALDAPDVRAEILALETFADVLMYTGELGAAVEISSRLAEVGRGSGDLHGYSAGVVGVALARIYDGDHDGGLSTIDGVENVQEMAPTDVGWVRYARAEGLVADQPARAIEAYRQAFDLASPVDGRYLALVARASMAAALARHGEPREAIEEFLTVIADHQRHGNFTHATTTLRNLIELFVRLDLNESAMTLLGALSDDRLKTTFGVEEESLVRNQETIEKRVGHGTAERWADAGSGRGVRWALSYGHDSLAAL
jgi:tetratricopeptide (TPR) repeat protein